MPRTRKGRAYAGQEETTAVANPKATATGQLTAQPFPDCEAPGQPYGPPIRTPVMRCRCPGPGCGEDITFALKTSLQGITVDGAIVDFVKWHTDCLQFARGKRLKRKTVPLMAVGVGQREWQQIEKENK